MNPTIKNAGDEAQVRGDEAKSKRTRERELNDVRAVLSTPSGRRFIWRYLELCDRQSAQQSGSWTYFFEGERNIALKIKTDVMAAEPEALVKMMLEAQKEI